MLRRQRELRIQVQRLLDAGVFGFALWLAHFVRSVTGFTIMGGTPEIEPFSAYLYFFAGIIVGAPILLHFQGFYHRPLLPSRAQSAWQIFKAASLMMILIISMLFIFRIQLARSVILLQWPLGVVLMIAKEEIARRFLLSRFGISQLKRRVILAGSLVETIKLASDIHSAHKDSVEVVSQIDINSFSAEKLADLLHEHSVNAVIISAGHTVFEKVERAIQACELEGVEAWLVADFFNTNISQTSFDDIAGRPLLVFRSAPEDSWQRLAKQSIDFVGSAFCIVVCAPLFLLLAAAVRLTSPGPVFFKQNRSGLNGQPFTMYKFRTMVTNAEQLKHELAVLNEMTGPVFKVTNDPRITPVGRFLRKWSLDELPQMMNVLKGEMSLVGPRPLPVDETLRFDDLAHRRRLSVKPGLTCLWQIRGRNNVKDFKEWVRLDLEYIDNWSLWLDLLILIRTVPVVLAGSGAK